MIKFMVSNVGCYVSSSKLTYDLKCLANHLHVNYNKLNIS